MFFLKVSLKALINLTNIPCFQPEKNNFNPKGNRRAKRELFLHKSLSNVPLVLVPMWGDSPSPVGMLGTGHSPQDQTQTGGTGAGSVCTFPALSRARIRPGTDLCLPLQLLQVYLGLLSVFTCLVSTPLSQKLEEQCQSLRWGL